MFTVNKSFEGTGLLVDKDSEGKFAEKVSNLMHTKY